MAWLILLIFSFGVVDAFVNNVIQSIFLYFVQVFFFMDLFKGTIEYEAHLKHENEMKRLEAELRGK